MVRAEQDRQSNPENGNIRFPSPADLMRDNPAALIVNRESYGRMAANFAPNQFDPPQTVRVITYSSEHGEVVRELVLDGMTRTKYVNDKQAQIAQDHPDFRFNTRDVTSSVLQNTAIIPVEERTDNQQTLTMLQYLRAVIPPTIEHSQIAPDRIAAHLINAWDNMVGEDIAKKYSALAALSLLGNQGVNVATDAGLRRDLITQPKIMTGETVEERVRIQQALVEMAAIIRQTKLNRQTVTRSAFMLVSEESSVIGGEREARRQIYGYLYTPEIGDKLEEASDSVAEREQLRDQLGQLISATFKRIGNLPNKEEVVNVIGTVIRDRNLDLDKVKEVISAADPVSEYDNVRKTVNVERLKTIYINRDPLSRQQVVLSSLETTLIDQLGRKTILSNSDISASLRAIKGADEVYNRAEQFKAQLSSERATLITQGVREDVLDAALPQISTVEQSLAESASLAVISRKTQELTDTLNEVNRRISFQITVHKAGDMVDQINGDKLTQGYGPQIKNDIIEMIVREFRTLDDRNTPQVRQRIKELSSLDHDLFLAVKNAQYRLSRAIAEQNERNRPKPVPKPEPQPTQPADQSQVTPTVEQSSATQTPITKLQASPHFAPPPNEWVPPSAEANLQYLEAERKQNNKDRLRSLLGTLNDGLNNIDLDPTDITDTEREQINRTVRRLGVLAYNHPNTPLVMLEHYPRLQRQVEALQRELQHLAQEQSDRDTRTRI